MDNCQFCENELENKNNKFCSFSCNAKFQNIKRGTNPLFQFSTNLRQKNINLYGLNPKHCSGCNRKFEYDERRKKFCNHSCAATVNNLVREPKSEIERKKISDGVKSFNLKNPGFNKIRAELGIKVCSIHIKNCTSCKKKFVCAYKKGNNERKTCSYECRIKASTSNRPYQNGSRKTQYFFNITQGKDVLLESSWEVNIATLLDVNGIKWIRPEPIKWIDDSEKLRYYYPDFYLPEFQVYLDPKNPYCMKQDVDKMRIVSDKIDIIYGDLKIVQEFVQNLNSNKG